MIPKKIHYCWFGGNPMPELAKKCMDSWKKYCPDYEIVEWNESNFDVNCCEYVKEAYEAKKWAFVSDYARFQILYENGGIYLDTDVELIKPMDDILARGAFMGVESVSPTLTINPGVGIATDAGNAVYRDLLVAYHSRHFKNKDGSLNLKTIVEYTTEYFQARGLQKENEIQTVAGIRIYPKEYFNPCDMQTGKINPTQNTVSVHHFAGSWVDSYSKFRGKVYRFLNRIFGKGVATFFRKLFGRNKNE